jgi:hypothetical protein
MPTAAQPRDIVGPIVAAAAATLHRLTVAETAFPQSKHVLWHVEDDRHFADGPESVR